MAHVSDSALKYDDMSSTQLLSEMMAMMKVLAKKDKKLEKEVTKVEEKKAKAAPKGVAPPQFAQNSAWVEYVHAHVLSNGWESFVHAERCGKGMVDVEYPASVLVPMLDEKGKAMKDEDGDELMIHIFDGSGCEQPNLSHAMTLSKLYRTSKPALYQEFLAQYVPPPPAEGAAVPAAEKPVVKRVSMTLEERRAKKAAQEAEKEAEKERKKQVRAEAKAAKEAKAAAEKAAKLAAKGSKAPKAAVLRAPVPVKRAAVAASVVKSVATSSSVRGPEDDWPVLTKGKAMLFMLNDTLYHRDHLNRMFEDKNGVAGDCVGVYMPATKTISDEESDMPEDD